MPRSDPPHFASRHPRMATALALAVIFLLPLLFFARYFPFSHIVDWGEIGFDFGMRITAAGFIRAGALPLWNPFFLCGTPLAADTQSGALYPLNIPFLFLSPAAASNAILLLHYALAGVFAFLYLRGLGISRAGALWGAVTYAFSGILVTMRSHTSEQNAAVWLPLILLCATKNADAPRWRWVALGAIAVALQVLSGYFQVVAITLIPVLLLFLFSLFRPAGKAAPTRAWISFPAIYLVGTLLSGVLLALTVELTRHSVRAHMSYEDFISSSFHPAAFILALFPHAFGTSVPTLFGSGYWGPSYLNGMASIFCGVAPLALACIAVMALRRSHRAVAYLSALALVGLVLSLGGYTPLYRLLYHVPVYNLFRGPCRNLLIYNLALSALSGFGVDALLGRCRGVPAEDVRRSTGRVIAGLCLVVLSSAFFLASFPSFIRTPSALSGLVIVDQVSPPLREILMGIRLGSNAFLFPLCVMGATAALLALLRGGYRTGRVLPLLFGVLWLDLMSFGSLHWATDQDIRPILDADSYPAPVTALISLGARAQEFRVCPFSTERNPSWNSLTPPANLFYRIPSCTGYGPFIVKRYADLSGANCSGWISERLMSHRPLLSLLNVRYVLCARPAARFVDGMTGAEGPPRYRRVWEDSREVLYENPAWLPRAWLVPKVRRVRSFDEARGILLSPAVPGFDPSAEALVEAEKIPALLGPRRGTAVVTQSTPSGVKIRCATEDRNFLVLSEIFYPGWEASIDGRETALYAADGVLRGIFVPPGNHEIEFRYRPMSFRIGLIGSALGLAVLILMACLRESSGEPRGRTSRKNAGSIPRRGVVSARGEASPPQSRRTSPPPRECDRHR